MSWRELCWRFLEGEFSTGGACALDGMSDADTRKMNAAVADIRRSGDVLDRSSLERRGISARVLRRVVIIDFPDMRSARAWFRAVETASDCPSCGKKLPSL